MGLLHTTYFIPKKKCEKIYIFFGKDWVWRDWFMGWGECPPPPYLTFFMKTEW